MTLHREGEYITATINGQSETMHIGEWSKIISRPGKIERFTFARGTPDHFSTDEYNEPPARVAGITVTINGQSETMHIGEWSKIISRPSRIERFTFARGTPDHFSTDEHIEPPCA